MSDIAELIRDISWSITGITLGINAGVSTSLLLLSSMNSINPRDYENVLKMNSEQNSFENFIFYFTMPGRYIAYQIYDKMNKR